jgi:hypothetical protein
MNGVGKLVKGGTTVVGEFFADRLVGKLSRSAVERLQRDLAEFIGIE